MEAMRKLSRYTAYMAVDVLMPLAARMAWVPGTVDRVTTSGIVIVRVAREGREDFYYEVRRACDIRQRTAVETE